MDQPPTARDEYIRSVLNTYLQTPGAAGVVRRPDRVQAEQWYGRGIPLSTVKNAMVLAVFRRLFRAPDAPPLNTIRSLAYFSPVIEEVLEHRISPQYFQYARGKISRFLEARAASAPRLPRG